MYSIPLINRSHCVISGTDDLEELSVLNDAPVFMGCVLSPAKEDLFADMAWSISRSSGLIQLTGLVPLDILYPESHGSGAIGRLWNMHHKAFAKYICKSSPDSVLEIGGAHGILSKEYSSYANIPWYIVEPNPSPVDGCSAQFIKGFFDDNFVLNRPINTVVHSHVFEHLYEPDVFMRHLSGFMNSGDKLIFSLPNMQKMLQKHYTNCLNFEHTVFLTEPYIEFLLSKYGFSLEDKTYFQEDHSIFYSCVRDNIIQPSQLDPSLYDANKKLYLDYVGYHQSLIQVINEKMSQLQDGRKVYLFGAHIFSQSLIGFGLDISRIECILDNDSNKHSKRLYGTDLKVASPKILANSNDPVVILKAGVYNNEIKQDILENINPRVVFLE